MGGRDKNLHTPAPFFTLAELGQGPPKKAAGGWKLKLESWELALGGGRFHRIYGLVRKERHAQQGLGARRQGRPGRSTDGGEESRALAR